jgi:glycosyltransferase A (GT-A) superfamily protein (DUF2064 family)
VYIVQAAGLLEPVDLVLGPAEDGGYYLIGMSRPHPNLFDGIAWSTKMVLAQTLDRAQELGLNSALTPPWRDVDTADDLARFQDELQNLPPLSAPNIWPRLGAGSDQPAAYLGR